MKITHDNVIGLINREAVLAFELTREQLDNDIFELGLNSMSFIQIIIALEEEFNIEIPENKLLITEMNTVSKMVDVLICSKGELDTKIF